MTPESLSFFKYHGLGNDYIVIPVDLALLPAASIQQICHRNYGLGSDGILVPVPAPSSEATFTGNVTPLLKTFGLRIFNPDGSEAEKSGNGLRIFARWLYDQGQVPADEPFGVWVPGGWVRAQVSPGGSPITIEMGQASFDSTRIPVYGPRREVIDEPLQVGSQELRICGVTLGNPHCVVLNALVNEVTTRQLGPRIENHPSFPRRTNVQFLQILDRGNIAIQIWERGAGYTLASGSSACAAAAAAYRLGLVDANLTVHTPGGELGIRIDSDFSLTLTGPVVFIAEGTVATPPTPVASQPAPP